MNRKEDHLEDCIFCKIIAGEVPAQKIYEDDEILAFDDINPQAPVHALVIPKKHVATLNDLGQDEGELMGRMAMAAIGVAKAKGLEDSGYRLVTNCLAEAGQAVFHIHTHVLGGRRMNWPPG
jgi:histidine triad (HIT) family protein